MKKDNVMSAVLGLVVGLVVGFVFANNFNRSAGQPPPAPGAAADVSSKNPNLPSDHPPIGTTSAPGDEDQPKGPRPEVAAAIDKAKSKPQDYEAQMTAADLYYQIQRFDDASKFYEIAAKLKPSETEPMIKAGNAFFDGEKYVQAQKWYELALQKEPKNTDVRTDLGLTFFLREPKDIDRAIKEYNTVLSIKPDHEVALQNLSLAYTEKGDRTNFQNTLERLKKVNPNNPVVTKSDAK
jgi:tetratricopeptide (TPR) repeat protein